MPRRPQTMGLPSIGALDRSAGQLGRQLAQALRNAIRSRELKPGESLPSTRHLAKSLGLARGTVSEAFEQLIAEGFLEAHSRVGTRVATTLTDLRLAPAGVGKAAKNASPVRLSEAAIAIVDASRQFTPLPPVPFAVSVPTGPAAPDDVWRRLGNRIRARGPGAPSGYEHPQGLPVLREAIADYVRRARSVHCSAEQVVVTAGTQQGLYIACQVLLDSSDTAWVEDPAYRGITGILESMGRKDRMIHVPVDHAGIDVDAGMAMDKHARAAFVTPSHQYPLGVPMSMGRRSALLAWARLNDAWIVEDDYDSELRYSGHPFPSLQGLAPDRVIYLGTFSKILFPSLRLGYAIVPEALVSAFCGARNLIDRHSPSADQHVIAAFLAEGHMDRHIRRIRGVYADRREQLIAMLARWMPKELGWLQPSDQGMHLMLWLAKDIDDELVASSALKSGVAVRAVSPMYSPGKGEPGLILGLGGFSNEAMETAIRQLVKILLTMRKQKPLASQRTSPKTPIPSSSRGKKPIAAAP